LISLDSVVLIFYSGVWCPRAGLSGQAQKMAEEEGAMSLTRMLAEGHLRVATGGGAPAGGGIAVRYLPHHIFAEKGGGFFRPSGYVWLLYRSS
jgi:hypothetical protein